MLGPIEYLGGTLRRRLTASHGYEPLLGETKAGSESPLLEAQASSSATALQSDHISSPSSEPVVLEHLTRKAAVTMMVYPHGRHPLRSTVNGLEWTFDDQNLKLTDVDQRGRFIRGIFNGNFELIAQREAHGGISMRLFDIPPNKNHELEDNRYDYELIRYYVQCVITRACGYSQFVLSHSPGSRYGDELKPGPFTIVQHYDKSLEAGERAAIARDARVEAARREQRAMNPRYCAKYHEQQRGETQEIGTS